MRRSSVFVAVVAEMMLLVLGSSAFAAPATHFILRLNNATVPWRFPPPVGLSSFCPVIPTGVNINPVDRGSDRVRQVIQKDMPDGTKQIVTTDLVRGTARDNSGAPYKFVYQNDATFDFDGTTVKVKMQDTFKLKGGAVNYTAAFNWRWAYPASRVEVVEVKDDGETVNFVVDPFIFATNNGVNEDPNIVRGSWQKLRTLGDPWNCDPL